MTKSIDQVIQTGRSRESYESSRPGAASNTRHATADLREQYTASGTESEPPLYGLHPNDNSMYQSSTSTLVPSGNSPQKPQNEEPARSSRTRGPGDGFTDFFSKEVFQIILHNPTTAHRFLRFCQTRACAENIEFLQKVDQYHRLLDEVTKVLADIHTTYTAVEAARQINISYPLVKRLTANIKTATQTTLPAMENIFAGAQEHIEKLLATDIYPRFVRHQVTTSATVALGNDKARFQGLGDCFCMTDPRIADNPITFASDGFVEVTGYTRRDIVPRNCRFLQGLLTDKLSTKRLRASIDAAEETVELLLNYRKNGDPFWNLLYVSPLLDEEGNVVFFLGGQINCSTTIHSCTDILKILSLNDEGLVERAGDLYDAEKDSYRPPSGKPGSNAPSPHSRSSFFQSFRKQRGRMPTTTTSKVTVRSETGMEGELIDRIGKLDFRTQVEAFYTAYSKYLVLKYSPLSSNMTISFFSPGVIDMLCLNLPNGSTVPIYNKDIFKILADYSLSSSAHKSLRSTVKECIQRGNAVSIELGLLTGIETKRGGFGIGERKTIRAEEKYVSHWTPMKDEEGKTSWVILTIAPK